jgi:hypothetical protein
VFGLGSQAGLYPLFLKQFTYLEYPKWLRVFGLAVLVFLGVWAAVPWGKKRVTVPYLGRRTAGLWILLFLPLAVLWFASLYRPAYLVGRYDLVAFPAFLLLLGFALAKLHALDRLGPFAATLVALLLCIPVGTKLFLYYRGSSPRKAQAGATVIHTFVKDGDVVVFTGQGGLPILYYLHRRGYRWEGGECRDEVAGRRFGCRMYPRETEQHPALYDSRRILTSPHAARDDVRDLIRMLRSEEADLWVVFGSSGISQQVTMVSKVDVLLVQELHRVGLRPVAVAGVRWIIQFRRPQAGRSSS